MKKLKENALVRLAMMAKPIALWLALGALLDILAIAVSLFSIVYTIGTAIAYNTITLGFWLFMLFIAVFLLGVSTILVITAIQANVELFCLLAGKYKIEIDRVTQIELKNTRKQPSNVFAHALPHPDRHTWKYVRFEHNGRFKIEPERKIVCLVLADTVGYYFYVSVKSNISSCSEHISELHLVFDGVILFNKSVPLGIGIGYTLRLSIFFHCLVISIFLN